MINFNDPIVQLQSIEQAQPIYTFLYDMFVDDKGPVSEEEALWDVKRGDLPMAPFINDNIGGVPVQRQAFVTDKMRFPTIAPERIVKPIDIAGRAFGEVVYGGKTPEQRAAEMIADDLNDLRFMIQKRREWMVAQLLFSGKLDIIKQTGLGGVEVADCVVDFNFKNKYTASTKWDQPGHDIFKDIENCVDLVHENLGAAEVIVMDQSVKNAIFADDKYLKMLDIKSVAAGELRVQHTSQQGVTFIGYSPSGLEMYVYNRQYEEKKGKKQGFIPKGKFIVGAKKMFNGYHGPITQINEDGVNGKHQTYIVKELPLRYADTKSNIMLQRLTSRPMFAPKNVDGWVVGEVL